MGEHYLFWSLNTKDYGYCKTCKQHRKETDCDCGKWKQETWRNYGKTKTQALNKIKDMVREELDNYDELYDKVMVVWENPDFMKSVPDLWHVQIILRRKERSV